MSINQSYLRSNRRDLLSGSLMAQKIRQLTLPEKILVVNDTSEQVAQALRQIGSTALTWHRFAYGNQAARPWPPPEQVEGAILRLPKGWAAFHMLLSAIAARLRQHGYLWVYGGNDEGIRSAPKHMQELYDSVKTVAAQGHQRIVAGRCRSDNHLNLRSNLEDWQEALTFEFPTPHGNQTLELVSFPGIFAHGRLDKGSACFLQALPQLALKGRILDFGCGAGVLACVAQKLAPRAQLTLLDIDAIALFAAKKNLPEAHAVLSDGWSALREERPFDFILSNPPFHRGKACDKTLLTDLIVKSKHHLKARGKLVLVTQRTAGVSRLLRQTLGKTQVLFENQSFQVWQGTRQGA